MRSTIPVERQRGSVWAVAVYATVSLALSSCGIGSLDSYDYSLKDVQRKAASLEFSTQPGDSIRNVPLPTQPVVRIVDSTGKTVETGPDSTRAVTVALATGTGSMTGTLTATAVKGIASFSGLTADATGVKTLTASATVLSGNLSRASASFTIQPPAPGPFTLVSATPGNGQVTLVWTASPDAASYTVRYGTTSGSYTGTFSTTATSPTTVTGLTNGTLYYFMVTAVNATASTDATPELSATPLAPPSAPTTLTAVGGLSNVALTWTASTGGGTITYDLYRSTTSGTYGTALASGLSGTTYTDLTALNGTTYYYTLKASNAGGTSAASNEASARPISSFTISSVTVNGGSALQVSWAAATGAAAYTLKYGTTSGTYGTTVSTTATSPATVTGLTPGTTYYFMVTATNAVGGGASVDATSEMSGVPMAAFTISSVTQPTSAQANVAWGSSTGSTSYTLKYGTASGGPYGTTVTASATSPQNVTGLTNGTAYYFMVYAVNASGTLPATTEGTLTPVGAPSVPASLTATGGASSISLSWSASTGGGTIVYDIYRSTTSGTYGAALVSGQSGTTYSDLAVTNGTTYYYTVQARNAGGSSASSNEASARPISTFTISGVTVNGGSALQVSWGAATGAAAYTLKYGTTSGTYGTTVSTTATSPTTVTGLTPGTTYYFMVTATNAVGGGASVNATEASGIPMAAFSISSVTQPASGQADVAWGSSTGSTSYTVKYGTASGGPYGTTVSTTATSPQNVTGLTNGTQYYFMVYAVNASGTLPASAEVALTPVAAPSAPTSLTAAGKASAIDLAWTAATGGGTIVYDIYRSTTSGTYGAALVTGQSSVTYTDSAVTNGTTYYYTVKARNAGGTSAASNEASARPIAAFTLSAVTVNGGSALQVSWAAATGAAAYTLKYGTVSGTYGTTVSTSATSPTTVTGLTPGTTYYFMVTATNAVGGGASVDATAEMSGVPMAAFSITSVTQPTSGQADVAWGASTGSTSYTLKYGTASGGPYGTTVTASATSPQNVTGLTNGTTYYFMVYAVNASGTLPASAEGTLSPTGAPGTPGSLTAVGGISNIALSWSASSGGGTITYDVYRSTTSGSYGAALATGLSGTTYTDLTALNGTTYYYVVKASNAGGTSAASNEASARPISSFTISGVTVNGGSALQVSWAAATGAAAYTLKYGTTSGTYGTTVSTTATSPTTVTGLTPGTTYYFMVTATNAVGGGASVNATSEGSGVPMAAFSISSVTQPTSAQADVSWGSSTGSTSYTVKYGTASGGPYGTTVSTTATSPQNVTGLTNGTQYYFMVYAVNASGTLPASAEVALTPVAAPSAPTSLTATGGASSISLGWAASTGGGTIVYDIYRSTTSGSYGAALVTGQSSTIYTDLAVTNGTTYYYTVKARNAGGTSAASNEASARPIANFSISSVTVNGGSALQVTWGAATGAAAYTLKYGTTSGTYGTTVSTTATSPTTVTGLTPGTTYYFMVTATNAVGGGASVDASEVSGVPMAAFSITSVTQPGSGQADVAWGSSTGSTSYTVKYGTASGGPYGTTVSTTATSPQNVTGLTNGTQYYFMVYAVNASGTLPASAEGTLTPAGAPSAPASLTAVGGLSNIALSWTASSGGGTIVYDIYRSTTAGTYGAALVTGQSGTTYSDLAVTNGTTYYYTVKARNAGGTSAASNEASARPISSFTLSSVTVNGGSALQVSWAAATGAAAYTLKYGTTSGTYGTTVSTSATSPTTVTGLTAGTTYYFMVTATNAVGGGASVDATAEMSGVPMSAFTMSTTPGTGQVQVSWIASTGSTSYTLKYGTTSGTYGTTVSTSATSPTTVTGLTAGTTYYFMVYAVNGSGTLPATSEATAVPNQAFTHTWPFTAGTDASYSFINPPIQLTGGTANLVKSGTYDSSNASAGFGSSTMTGAAWDSGNNYVKLGNAGGCDATTTNCSDLDATWAPKWSNIVGYWKLNGTVGAVAGGAAVPAAVGPNLTTYNTGGTGLAYANGKVRQGMHFDGVDDYAEGSDSGFPNSNAARTLCVWTKADSTSAGYHFAASWGTNATDQAFGIGRLGSSWLFSNYGTATHYVSVAGITTGLWHHLCSTWDGTTIRAYLDGALAGSLTPATLSSLTLSKVRIGQQINGSSEFWDGDIDDVAIWNTTLTASEISAMYSRQSASYSGQVLSRVLDAGSTGAGASQFVSLNWISQLPFGKELPAGSESSSSYASLVGSTGSTSDNNLLSGIAGLWHFNETSLSAGASNDFADSSANGRAGEAAAGSSFQFASGRFGNSLVFDGSTSQVLFGDVMDFTGTSPFTVSVWFRTKVTSMSRALFTKTATDGGGNQGWLAYISGNNIYFERRVNSAQAVAGVSATIDDQAWHHFVGVYTGTQLRTYLDGVAGGTAADARSLVDTASNLRLGLDPSSAAFDGSMDEAAVWSRALHPTEVQQLYRRGANRVRLQARSCTTADCSDDPNGANWKGPDNTRNSYFSELYNYSAQSASPSGSVQTSNPLMTFSNFGVAANGSRYLQYRAILESDSNPATYGPTVSSVTVGPSAYDSTHPRIVTVDGHQFQTLTGFSETLGAGGCAFPPYYQLSVDRQNWYYHNGTTWVAGNNTSATANGVSNVNTNISTFPSVAGTGTLYVRAFVRSDGAQPCELDGLSVSGTNGTLTTSSNPGAFTATAVRGNTQATLSWTASSGATAYTVKYGTTSGTYTTTLNNQTSPLTISGLTNGTAYYFMVVASNGTTTTDATSEVTATPVGVPAAPTSLTATGGTSSVSLSWTAPAGSSITYNVRRSTTSGSGYATLISGLNSTSYVDTTPTNGTTYYYVVTATNDAGTGADSNEVSARPIASFAITAVAVNGAGGLQLSWSSASGAAAYTVKYGTASGTYGTTASTSATSPYTVTGLTAGTTYYFMVTATNAVGSGTSVNARDEMSGIPLASFSITSATAGVGTTQLAWGNSTGASSYTVRYGTTSGSYPTIFSTSATSPTTVTGLTSGTTYYFMVYAVNPNGFLAATAQATAVPTQAFTQTYPFTAGTEASYSLSAFTELAGGYARLKAVDQVDDDNTSTGFAGSTMTGVTWDSGIGSSGGVRLSQTSATNNSALTSDWAPQYSSLIGYWKMDGTTGSNPGNNAAITATVGSNGTLVDASTVSASYASGQVAQGLALGGSDDYINLGRVSGLEGQSAITLMTWVNTTTLKANAGLLLKLGAGPSGIGFNSSSSQTDIALTINDSTANYCITGTGIITTGIWQHFALVFDGSQTGNTNRLKFYVNGIPVSLTCAGTIEATTTTNTTNLTVGSNGAASYYAGSFDDVSVWNAALSANNVQLIYSRQSAKYSGMLTSRVMDGYLSYSSWTTLSWVPTLPFFKGLPDYSGGAVQNETSTSYSSLVGSTGTVGDNNLMTGILGLWHLDEPTGATTAIDSSGQGNNMSIVGGTVKPGYPGIIGLSNYMTVSNHTNLPPTATLRPANLSISAWIRPLSTQSGNEYQIVSSKESGGYSLMLTSSTGNLTCAVNSLCAMIQVGGTYQTVDYASSNLPANQWSHVATTYDGSTIRLYVNGTEVGTPKAAAGTISYNATPAYFCVGSEADGTGCAAGSYFQGFIDEVAVWNRGLHASEVRQLYRRGANRVKFQVRVCTTSNCSDDATGANWKGPDGTRYTYFSELFNMSTQSASPSGTILKSLPSMLFSNFTSPVSTGQYFQYRTILESDDSTSGCNYGSATWCSPELKSVTAAPNHYFDGQIATVTARPFVTLTGFTATLGSCPTGLGFTLSIDQTTWYWWNAAANAGAGGWVVSSGSPSQINSASQINANLSTFPSQVGTGNLYVRVRMVTNNTDPCEIDQIQVDGTY